MKQSCREDMLGLEGAVAGEMTGDASPWIVRNVKLLGTVSQKGRRYTDQALEGATKLYEGKPIYKNHVKQDPSLPPGSFESRGVEDSLGFVRNVRHVPGEGLFGDACFTVKDKLTESVMIAASPKGNPTQYGFSPHHYYDGKPGADGLFDVTVINHVESVDLVTKPATTGGLFEGVTTVADKQPDKVAEKPAKRTARMALEALPRLRSWEKKLILGLEDMADAIMPDAVADGQQSVEGDDMTAAFQAMIAKVFAGAGDLATKKKQIGELLKTHDKLTNSGEASEGEQPPYQPAAAKEGAMCSKEGDKVETEIKKEEKKDDTEGIGAVQALKLFEKYKLQPISEAVESVQVLKAPIAETIVKRFAAQEEQITKLKGLLPEPKSIPRGAWKGISATEGKQTTDKGERKIPTWASVN